MLYVDERTAATAFQAVAPDAAVDAWEEEPPGLLDAAWLLLDRLPPKAADWFRARRDAGLRNALSRYGNWRGGVSGQRFKESLPFLDYLQLPERPGSTDASATESEPRPDRSAIHSPTAPTPLTDTEVAAIQRAGVETLVRTRGESGVIVHSPSAGTITLPARSVDLVDPTGAGDALTAGILDGLLSRVPLGAAVERGLDWAARACRHLGARGWLDAWDAGGRYP
jgi:sugar/nucleoside kinase (ribokinase family)